MPCQPWLYLCQQRYTPSGPWWYSCYILYWKLDAWGCFHISCLFRVPTLDLCVVAVERGCAGSCGCSIWSVVSRFPLIWPFDLKKKKKSQIQKQVVSHCLLPRIAGCSQLPPLIERKTVGSLSFFFFFNQKYSFQQRLSSRWLGNLFIFISTNFSWLYIHCAFFFPSFHRVC